MNPQFLEIYIYKAAYVLMWNHLNFPLTLEWLIPLFNKFSKLQHVGHYSMYWNSVMKMGKFLLSWPKFSLIWRVVLEFPKYSYWPLILNNSSTLYISLISYFHNAQSMNPTAKQTCHMTGTQYLFMKWRMNDWVNQSY